MTERRLYIAYGSNLDTDQMAYRCPGARVVARSWLRDHKLEFRGAAYNAHATVVPMRGYKVPVLIWELTPSDEAALDRYEGVRGGYYTKETYYIEVEGKLEQALIYIMCPRRVGIPTSDYYHTIEKGYLESNFPLAILREAKHNAWVRVPWKESALRIRCREGGMR